MSWSQMIGLGLLLGIPTAFAVFAITKAPKKREYWAEDFEVPHGPRDDVAP